MIRFLPNLRQIAFSALTALCAIGTPSHAAIFEDEKDIRWVSNRDLTGQQFADRYRQYRAQGYMMTDIDAYATSAGTRYSMVWRENTDGRNWAENRGMDWNGYVARWRQYRARGYRPHDIETWKEGSDRKWAGIWIENRENLDWASYRGLTSARYAQIAAERRQNGFRLLDMEAYQTRNGLRYTAIWIENRDNRAWSHQRDMSRATYQQQVTTRSANGFRVVDYEAYRTNNTTLYAAIWERKDGYGWDVRTNRTRVEFANLWRKNSDAGMRLIDFERTETPSGPRYASIWAENAPRYRTSWRRTLNGMVQAYRTTNGFPGASVAVIRDGAVIYRYGDGFADVAAGKAAHGRTIYSIASVSKAVGGTLAAKLENEGQLQDGTAVTLNLNNLTSSFLTNIPNANGSGTVSLPNQHTHTVAQLLAHLGCVGHYASSTTPGGGNPTTHFTTATAAVQTFWNLGLVTDRFVTTPGTSPCLVGGNVGQRRSYSTHAFTMIGAVLEQVTGRTVAQLVDQEISNQYNLGTLRTMYSSSTLPAAYDRSKAYASNDSTERDYRNNSWKVLGGGLESNAIDLARFGWRVLNGDIVNATARDCRMWVRVGQRSNNGLGWWLGNSGNNRRIADHAGDALGAEAYLRIYRDEGLVVAILANRNVSNGTRRAFADNIGNLILGTAVAPVTNVPCP